MVKKALNTIFRGNEYSELIKRKIKSRDTIGVGDTFFGYFVGFLYKGKTAQESVILAINKTTEFLNSKTYE